jgi:dipeptidyl aminopeptidase/acylaminoacyl peptidase
VPVLPLDLCLSGGDITDVRVRPGGLWVSGVHTTSTAEEKQSVVRMWHVVSGATVDVSVGQQPATGRGLSGGVHRWSDDGSQLVVALRDGGLAVCTVTTDKPDVVEVLAIEIIANEGSFINPVFSQVHHGVWAIRDWHDVVLLRRSVNGEWIQEQHTHSGDFAWDVDEWNGEPIFHTWNRPEMPWTYSRIHNLYDKQNVAVQQPRTSQNRRAVGFLCDANGTLNLTVIRDGRTTVIEDSSEHGGPTWGPGSRTWCFNSDASMVAYTRNENGYGSLWVRAIGNAGAPLMVGKAVHGCLSWEGNTLTAIRSGARTAPEVVSYNMMSLLLPQAMAPTKKTIAFAGDARWHNEEVKDELVEPTVIHLTDCEVVVRLYVPRNPNGVLMSWAHGGPTDQWQVSFMPRHAFWLSRGYTIAIIDYRGTTGYGRASQQRLDGQWGEGDARDIVSATRLLQAEYGYQPEHTVLVGASAGALAVLGAVVLAHDQDSLQPIAAGVVVSYPVVDLRALAQTDDPFEAHYVPRLVGAANFKDPLWGERSPHTHPRHLAHVPLLVFHGDSDTVVPLQQSETLRDAVTSVGGEVSLHVMAGEGHGFRNVHNQEVEYRLTEQFLRRFLP